MRHTVFSNRRISYTCKYALTSCISRPLWKSDRNSSDEAVSISLLTVEQLAWWYLGRADRASETDLETKETLGIRSSSARNKNY